MEEKVVYFPICVCFIFLFRTQFHSQPLLSGGSEQTLMVIINHALIKKFSATQVLFSLAFSSGFLSVVIADQIAVVI